jgi:large subunit ribosomal protein L21
MYAVIETSGRQYRVELGSEIELDQMDVEPGSTIELGRVLLVADGDDAHIGQPVVDGARVTGEVLRQDRGDKVVVFKYRPKARRRVKKGHRSDLTVVRVSDIVLNGRSAADEAEQRARKDAAEREAAEKEAARQAAADKALADKLAAERAVEEKAAEEKPKARTASRKAKVDEAAEGDATDQADDAEEATDEASAENTDQQADQAAEKPKATRTRAKTKAAPAAEADSEKDE